MRDVASRRVYVCPSPEMRLLRSERKEDRWGGGGEGEIYPGEGYHVTNIRKSVKEIKRYVMKQVHEIIYQLYREEDINMKKWNSWLYHIIIFFVHLL